MKTLYRYIFFIVSVVFCPLSEIWGQTIPGDMNAITHSKFRVATTNEADATDPAKALITIAYADGLGRGLQTVGYQQSPTNKDIVSGAVEFDKYGRVTRTALVAPTSSATGTYQNNALGLASAFYGDSYAFSATTSFDNSPLNRGREQYGAGNAWRSASKRIQSFDEAAGTDVRYYYLDGSGNILLSGNYPSNSLFKKRTIDEQGHTSIEISDKRGQLIQKQIQDDTGFITTYYIYDGLGRIAAVIQPQGYELFTGINKNSAEWQKWVFWYEYDYRGRMHLKHIPAAGDEYMVYDKWDRLVWSQTALQRETGKWTFYKYDAFNREVMRGEKSESRGLVALETEAWAWSGLRYESRTTSGIYYSYSNGYPQLSSDADIRQVTYYDNYTDWVPAGMAFANGGTAFHTQYTETQGAMVGSRSRSGINNNWLVSVLYYDNKGLVIRTLLQNLFSQIEQLDTQYNHAGEILQVKKIHKNQSGTGTTEITQNELDHTGRAKKVLHGIGITPIEVVRNTYDEIGRLTRKKIMPNNTYLASGTSIDGLQTIDLAYHLRGSLRGINLDNSGNAVPKSSEGDLFSYKLDYETAGFYDGNIGKQNWQGVNASNVATGIRDYTFTYDAAKRLTSASYTVVNGENYSIAGMTYDKNGNIKTLQRKGKNGSTFGDIDVLNYTYNGNQLNQVTDGVTGDHDVDFVPRGSGNYTYYTDGSLKSDENEGITLILYDTYLKQPKEIQLTGARKINYYYDGAGALLKTVYSTGEYWEYTGIIYKNGQPYQMPIPEGRAVYVSGAWQNEFFYTDHLGNTRVAYKANGTALTKTSETAFDPWGVALFGSGQVNAFQNKFEYQNKEKESTFNLRRISFGARTYNASIGRFDGVDPLASIAGRFSPFVYANNNPLVFVDPNGMASEDYTYSDGYSTLSAKNSTGSVGFNGAYFDDYTAKKDGTIEYKKTNDNFDRILVENKDGSTGQVAQLEKSTTSDGTTLVEFPAKGNTFTKDQSNTKDYIQPALAAAILGAANEYFNETGLKVQITQLNTSEGGHSGHSGKGTNADVRYANVKGNVNESVWTSGSNFDIKNSQILADKFIKFGFNQPGGLSILTENAKGTGPALQNTRFVNGNGAFHHKHHMHLQRYNFNNLKTVKP